MCLLEKIIRTHETEAITQKKKPRRNIQGIVTILLFPVPYKRHVTSLENRTPLHPPRLHNNTNHQESRTIWPHFGFPLTASDQNGERRRRRRRRSGGESWPIGVIFLGTGCSSAVPNAMCLIQRADPPCHVCFQSLFIPPHLSPNYRCNTSILIDYCGNEEGEDEHRYILIDVGKTFSEQVLRWFTFHKIPHVDSLVLTHEHADAILGLDDIHTVQPFSPVNDINPTPIYLSEHAMKSIAEKFPYLVQRKLKDGQEIRRVAQLDWKIIESDCTKPFLASGLQFIPLPVMHGEDYVALGFLFGKDTKVAYISDVSRFLPATENLISKRGNEQIDLLILDTLYKTGSHSVHFCLPQTLDAVKRISPKRALLIGMTHEFDHHKDNAELAEWSEREGIPVQLAHDGWKIPLDL